MHVKFTINGTSYSIDSSTISVETSLNTFIRNNAQLSGTKFMCLEGGCGACTVTVTEPHSDSNELKISSINSCVKPIFSCNGLAITTIEGLGNKKVGYNPIQTRLIQENGSHCGYCTPGMVMSMYSLVASNNGYLKKSEIETSLGGNLCRCTGYRSILDAFKSFAADADNCRDIEDLTRICPKREYQCASICAKSSKSPIHFTFKDDVEWISVSDLKSLFETFTSIGSKMYQLVAGNTAQCVYPRDKNVKVLIDINGVKELQTHSFEKKLEIGGNVTIAGAINILTEASQRHGFEYCKHIAKHFGLVASIAIRNVATLAGNLSLKYSNHKFPSDIFVLLEAVGATLTIYDGTSKTEGITLTTYLDTPMTNKVILKITLNKLDKETNIFRCNKIMPRAQNVHAIINAAYLFEMKDATIISANICYGGISADFLHATETENILIGQDLYSDDTLQQALNFLSHEINPVWVVPGASPEYRKQLALSLFYKFLINVSPKGFVKSKYTSGGDVLHRPLSSGTQNYSTYNNNWPLTKPIPKIDGLLQSSGEAKFINDMPVQQNELWAAFVPSSKIYASIGAIDPAKALKISGVQAFYSASDIPGINSYISLPMKFMVAPEEIFVGINSPVLYYGQPVGIILATSFDIANFAATKVKITYVVDDLGAKKRQPVPTVHEVFNQNANDRFYDLPMTNEPKVYNLCENLKKACSKLYTSGEKELQKQKQQQEMIQGKLILSSQYHFTLEPQTTVCIPTENGIDVYSSTEWLDLTSSAIAQCLNITENKIKMIVPRTGGSFGSRISRASHIACACALASFLSNQPVRFVLSLKSNMTTIGKRAAVINEYKVQTDETGKILNMKNTFAEDFGSTLNESFLDLAKKCFSNCYMSDNWENIPRAVLTDSPSNTFCEGSGALEGIAMIENIMEHIARVTGQDSISVRLANMSEKNPFKNQFCEFIKNIDFITRKKSIDDFNKKNRWRKRGIAVVPMIYPLDYLEPYPAYVTIYHADGSVLINHSGVEVGQGINTKVIQVAAYILGISMDIISIQPTNNAITANAITTGKCQTSEAVCYAVQKACEKLLQRMIPVQAKMKNASWLQIVQASYAQSIELTASYTFEGVEVKGYPINGCSCAEVEVDILTGNSLLKRVDILEDAGESMNPIIDIGKIEGSFVMGLGYWLTEKLEYDRLDGALLTNRTWSYYPPGANDIPVDFRVTLTPNSSNKNGVLRSKATGSPSICMSIVALFAIRYALDSARQDAGITEKWFELGAPSTTDDIFLNAGNTTDAYTLTT